jgi:hypothetical protein
MYENIIKDLLDMDTKELDHLTELFISIMGERPKEGTFPAITEYWDRTFMLFFEGYRAGSSYRK